MKMGTGKSLGTLQVLVWIACLNISLTWNTRGTQAAMYRHTGLCIYKNNLFEAGQTFYRRCDKCYCHNAGYICFSCKGERAGHTKELQIPTGVTISSPSKPTSWPRKCQRVKTECGYRVVYRENSALECRAYSWI